MTLARIGRFLVERNLGSGSFATVWLARDEDLEAWVAIKVLADNWSQNEDARRRFLEEARALRHLDNDRIVRVYEVGRLVDDRPFMVMEYADRGTLEDRIRARRELGRPFGIGEALDLSIEMAECLTSVHASRIVHRDVKPSNVLFRSLSREAREARRRDGRPDLEERTLLGDFGIARRLEGMLGHTLVLGSPHYMAPEQADPEQAGGADERSDVYSAAVVLYELLSGKLPHRFDSVADLQRADRERRPASLAVVRREVPPELTDAVHRGLAPDPERRYASAWEWRDALRAARQAIPHEDRVLDARAHEAQPTSRSSAMRAWDLLDVGTRRRRSSDGTTSPVPTRVGTERDPASRDAGVGGDRRGMEAARAALGAPGPNGPPSPWPASGGGPLRPDVHAAPARQPLARGVGPYPPSVRLPAATIFMASLAALVGVLLPWSSSARGSAFSQGTAVAVGAGLLFLAGLRMWRTRRRWVAIVASAVALAVAGVGVVLAPLTMLAVRDVEGGLALIFAAAIVASVGAYRALVRLQRDPRSWLSGDR